MCSPKKHNLRAIRSRGLPDLQSPNAIYQSFSQSRKRTPLKARRERDEIYRMPVSPSDAVNIPTAVPDGNRDEPGVEPRTPEAQADYEFFESIMPLSPSVISETTQEPGVPLCQGDPPSESQRSMAKQNQQSSSYHTGMPS